MSLPLLIRDMLRPGFYPDRPQSVQLVQTHISYVFLAGEHVYKVKKPVDFGFLDYSSLRKRAAQCRREVELNRRLSPELYLGVAKIYCREEGYFLHPPGQVVEYAVVMKRLPEGRLFSAKMARGKATISHSRRVARRVAAFHATVRAAAKKNCRLVVLRKNLEENFRQTAPYIGRTVSEGDYRFLWDYDQDFLVRRRFLLEKRIREGRIRDGHGDLHADHICLADGILIYDCLEFNPRLRQADVAADVAFLYMDLLYHRHPHLAGAFMEEYLRRTGDWEIRLLLSFYACYRAVVREKVESFRLSDPHIPRSHKAEAARRAARYFLLARDLARRDARPRLFTVGGLPGTGKTTLARAWAERLGADYFSSDVIRKELAGAKPTAHLPASYRAGIYDSEWTERTYRELLQRGEQSLRAGRTVVIDATFREEEYRRRAAAIARRSGARFVPVECRLSEDVIRRRLQQREVEGGSSSDAGWKVYLAMKKGYRPPSRSAVKVDTARGTEEGLKKIAVVAFPV